MTVCGKPEEAIALVQNREDPTNAFDVVLSDVDTPEASALQLLELFGIELATPVISTNLAESFYFRMRHLDCRRLLRNRASPFRCTPCR